MLQVEKAKSNRIYTPALQHMHGFSGNNFKRPSLVPLGNTVGMPVNGGLFDLCQSCRLG